MTILFTKFRKRNERSMLEMGGWLFADLLLGLAMLFLTANTFGSPPPTPTPTATPNLLATSEAQAAGAEASAAMQPKAGRASYLGDRALGVPDGGAVAATIWMKALGGL